MSSLTLHSTAFDMVSTDTFEKLQQNTHNIRNICILAHVDHGKTTLSDSLLASNAIISQKSSGKVRYLDSRPDEQSRGITMKSSAISLYFKRITKDGSEEDYLVNLMDSPGHVDFASEVSTASRLCDGALVLVDAVEGVCTQTHAVLKQAWQDNVKPILVINKLDKLITQLKLSPIEAYLHLKQILEQVNAITGIMFSQDRIDNEEDSAPRADEINVPGTEKSIIVDWHLEDIDDSHLYFSPEFGNVVFASAIDGWAFRIDQFSSMYSSKLGIKQSMLKKVLWGEWYLDSKSKRVMGPSSTKLRSLKPMFVQFVLDNIWQVYDAVVVNPDRERIDKIVNILGLKVNQRDLKSKDPKIVIQSVMSSWMPLSHAILLSVVEKVPSPLVAQPIRMPAILEPSKKKITTTSTNKSPLLAAIYSCDASHDAPAVGYISKIIGVPTSELPSAKMRRDVMNKEEMSARREKYLLALQSKHLEPGLGAVGSSASSTIQSPVTTILPPNEDDTETLIGFARLYSGTIKVGDQIYLLGPKYDPKTPLLHSTLITIDRLYLLMGRELQELSCVPAGNVFGISGLGESGILKTATISSTLDCPSFGSLKLNSSPIVRVALEPRDPGQMPQLVEGLRLLNQSDPCVQVLIQESGEHVIVTAGELHLERCLKDLRERFAKIEIQVSTTIVPFRETCSAIPSGGSNAQNSFVSSNFGGVCDRVAEDFEGVKVPCGTIVVNTPNKLCKLTIRAVPLPTTISLWLYDHESVTRGIVEGKDGGQAEYLSELKTAFELAQREDSSCTEPELWNDIPDQLWDFGPKRSGCNILLNCVPGFKRHGWNAASKPSKDDGVESMSDRIKVSDIQGSINSGFQLATQSGPLCNEPMMGMCFLIQDVQFSVDDETDGLQLGLLSGQIISTVKEACRLAFLQWSTRLMTAMYSCELQAPSDVLGKVYAVIARRKGRILSEEMRDGTSFFNIKSVIPVIESFGFSEDLWKKTSGSATPQLVFQGYEVLDIDPFWSPTTEEELEDQGEHADRENIARRYLDSIRKRKGLFVEKKVIEHAEKQKTAKQK